MYWKTRNCYADEVFKICLKDFFKTSRSSHQRCSVRKGVLKNLVKFTGKQLCQGLIFNRVFIKKETLAQAFFCEFCEISKNTFFPEYLRKTASEHLGDQKMFAGFYCFLIMKISFFLFDSTFQKLPPLTDHLTLKMWQEKIRDVFKNPVKRLWWSYFAKKVNELVDNYFRKNAPSWDGLSIRLWKWLNLG